MSRPPHRRCTLVVATRCSAEGRPACGRGMRRGTVAAVAAAWSGDGHHLGRARPRGGPPGGAHCRLRPARRRRRFGSRQPGFAVALGRRLPRPARVASCPPLDDTPGASCHNAGTLRAAFRGIGSLFCRRLGRLEQPGNAPAAAAGRVVLERKVVLLAAEHPVQGVAGAGDDPGPSQTGRREQLPHGAHGHGEEAAGHCERDLHHGQHERAGGKHAKRVLERPRHEQLRF
mmetsp:Transcript_4226/g.17864  ORF Transcript_4226/g.17864 Transcript_4226/m.17864 type:complete len:230 (-) Transcript_4226:4721-5410(-)